MSLKFVQTQAIALYTGMSAAATQAIVTPYPRDIQTNAKLVFADFGTTPTFTVDPKIPGYEEICSFTGITDNGDDTATLTGLVRNLIGQYPYTTPGTGKQHGSSAVVVFSDNPQMYARLAALENNNIFTGYNEGPNPITAQGYVTRDYMLALINGGAVSVNAIIETAIAGETIAAGNLIYFSETDNEWLKASASVLASLFNVKLGIAQGSGTNGNPITGGVLTRGSYTTSGLTQGDLCYAGNTAGSINSGTAGTVPRVIGIAKSSTVLYFDPDFQNRLYDYAVDAVGTDDYAVTMPGAFSVPFVGMEIKFKAGTANTGACTLNVNGTGAVAIKKNVTTALDTGDILANQIVKVVYDGTNYQMVSSITPVNMVNAGNSIQYMVGALSNAVAKVYFNVQLLFIMWTGATAGDATTSFVNWVRSSTDVRPTGAGAMCSFFGTGAEYMYVDTPFFIDTNNQDLQYNNTNTIIMDFLAKLPGSATGSCNMGFGVSGSSTFQWAYNDTTDKKVCFAVDTAGKLYAVINKPGVGITATDISSGLTITNWNNLRIELHLGTDAKFYVNGVLKATLSGANLPNGADSINMGFGRSNTALFTVTAPNISLQVI